MGLKGRNVGLRRVMSLWIYIHKSKVEPPYKFELLAAKFGCCIKTVRRDIKLLQDTGLLDIKDAELLPKLVALAKGRGLANRRRRQRQRELDESAIKTTMDDVFNEVDRIRRHV